jgi:hypothetical protein
MYKFYHVCCRFLLLLDDPLRPSVAAKGSAKLVQDGSVTTEDEGRSDVPVVQGVSRVAASLTVLRIKGQFQLGEDEGERGKTHDET